MVCGSGSGRKGKEEKVRITKQGAGTDNMDKNEQERRTSRCGGRRGDSRKEGKGKDSGILREKEPMVKTKRDNRAKNTSFVTTFEGLAGLLMGQNIPQQLTRTSSNRLVVAAWLVFAYVLVSVYNGNMTAKLTVPIYPPRPETLAELVAVTDR